jgi:NAD(P)-dependent dehydrogenase (short-subunit alcohol dehydrogenase family)
MTNPAPAPVIVITGASAGIGAAAAVNLSAQGWQVHGTGRSQDKLDAVAARCGEGFTGHVADFADLAQVRHLAEELSTVGPIDVLANNAGATVSGRRETVDGHELTNQGNHLAGFLLTHLLRDQLSTARIIWTSSFGHHFGRIKPDDLDWRDRRYNELSVYGTSKLANLMTAAELQDRWGSGVLSLSFHPGVVKTDFGQEGTASRMVYTLGGPMMRTSEQGADTLVFLATAPREALVPGAYYVNRKVGHASRQSKRPELRAALWDATTSALGTDQDL